MQNSFSAKHNSYASFAACRQAFFMIKKTLWAAATAVTANHIRMLASSWRGRRASPVRSRANCWRLLAAASADRRTTRTPPCSKNHNNMTSHYIVLYLPQQTPDKQKTTSSAYVVIHIHVWLSINFNVVWTFDVGYLSATTRTWLCTVHVWAFYVDSEQNTNQFSTQTVSMFVVMHKSVICTTFTKWNDATDIITVIVEWVVYPLARCFWIIKALQHIDVVTSFQAGETLAYTECN